MGLLQTHKAVDVDLQESTPKDNQLFGRATSYCKARLVALTRCVIYPPPKRMKMRRRWRDRSRLCLSTPVFQVEAVPFAVFDPSNMSKPCIHAGFIVELFNLRFPHLPSRHHDRSSMPHINSSPPGNAMSLSAHYGPRSTDCIGNFLRHQHLRLSNHADS
jgi:hypothetical protein